MKNTKRFLALLMALVMVCALGVCALADDPAPETGSITITNADTGKTYTLYKIFDATYAVDETTGKVSAAYSTDDADLAAAIMDDDDCPFKVVGEPNADGVYVIEGKDDIDADDVREWVLAAIEDELITATKTATTGTDSKTDVVFDELDLGYYMITPTEGLATLTTTTPDVITYDKNLREIPDPDKSTEAETVQLGDEVKYTIMFEALNYTEDEDDFDSMQAVLNYRLVDTYTGLDFVSIDSVKYYTSFTAESNDTYTIGTDAVGTAITGYTVDAATEEGTTVIDIPWADAVLETGAYYQDEDGFFVDEEGTAMYKIATADDVTDGIEIGDAINADGEVLTDDELTAAEAKRVQKIAAKKDGDGNDLKDAAGNVVLDITAKYPSPVLVVVEYTMKTNEDMFRVESTYAENNAENEVTLYHQSEPERDTGAYSPYKDDGEDSETVFTTGISIEKFGSDTGSTGLPGAFFSLYKNGEPNQVQKQDDQGEDLYYVSDPAASSTSLPETTTTQTQWPVMVDETDGDGNVVYPKLWYKMDKTNNVVTWIDSESDADKIEADTDATTMEFMGLPEGTYFLKEEIAPATYNPIAAPIKIAITAEVTDDATAGKTCTWTAYQDDDTSSNKINASGTYASISVTNAKGNALPETGGMGTRLFIGIGAMLFVVGGVILVTKKRMYNAG